MKKLVLTVLVIFGFLTYSFGQTNTFPTDGNVGIGTSSPTYNFHIKGTTYAGQTMESTLGYDNFVIFQEATKQTFKIGIDADKELFKIARTDFNDNSFVMDYAGNIGIGTTTPNSKLEVKSKHTYDQDDEIRIGSYYQNKFYGLGLNYRINSTGSPSKHLVDYTGDIRYTTMSFKNGNVGIGTTIPDRKLVVDGPQYDNLVIQRNGGAQLNNSIRFENGNQQIYLGASSNNDFAVSFSPDLGLNAKFIIKENGNAALFGKLETMEIKVRLSPTADFVFEEDYELKEIEEVEEFIKENKHLPEIPSAKEIEENGVNLAEMNAKLLQKIEELTLYLIEHNKTIQAQSKTISEQNTRISKLEEKLESNNN